MTTSHDGVQHPKTWQLKAFEASKFPLSRSHPWEIHFIEMYTPPMCRKRKVTFPNTDWKEDSYSFPRRYQNVCKHFGMFSNPLRGLFSCELTEGANSSYVTACCHGTRHVRTWCCKTSKQSMRLMLKELLSKRVLPKTRTVCVDWHDPWSVCNSHPALNGTVWQSFFASPGLIASAVWVAGHEPTEASVIRSFCSHEVVEWNSHDWSIVIHTTISRILQISIYMWYWCLYWLRNVCIVRRWSTSRRFFTGPPPADALETVAANKSSLRWRRPPPHTAGLHWLSDYTNRKNMNKIWNSSGFSWQIFPQTWTTHICQE